MNLFNLFSGKRTYAVGILAIIAGVTEVLSPGLIPIPVSDPGELIVMGLGFIFLRKGMR